MHKCACGLCSQSRVDKKLKLHFKFQIICKALERLLGWIYVITYLDPGSNPVLKHKDSVLKTAKVSIQISFKTQFK
jgi:hypothetical protein